MINWDESRKQFPVTERVAYLNSAATARVSCIYSKFFGILGKDDARDGDNNVV